MEPELNKNQKQNNEEGYVSKKPNVPKPGAVVKPTTNVQSSSDQEAKAQPTKKVENNPPVSENKMSSEKLVEEKKESVESIGAPKKVEKPIIQNMPEKEEEKGEIDFEDEIKGHKKSVEEKPKKSKKPLIIGIVLVVILAGLGSGGYFLYTSGILSDFLEDPMAIFMGNGNGGTQVENDLVDDAVVESSPSEEENTNDLDYLEDSLKNMESTVNVLQENYKLDSSLNIEDSTF